MIELGHKPRRTFTEEFKEQMVQLYKNGKRKSGYNKSTI